jgi:Domain of unknown function (DUF4190)/Domain of unknown function (DUF1707)
MAVDPGFDATRMLAANADRERAIGVLQGGFAEGRLTKAEYDDRTARVYAARTYGELGALVADLPAGPLAGVAHHPAAPYPDGWYPPREPAPAGTNSMAIAALVCGVAGFFIMGLTAVPAIVLGHAARRQLRRTGEQGDGLALAGLILGWAGIALIAVAVAALIIIAGHSAHPVIHADLPVVIKPDAPFPANPVKGG